MCAEDDRTGHWGQTACKSTCDPRLLLLDEETGKCAHVNDGYATMQGRQKGESVQSGRKHRCFIYWLAGLYMGRIERVTGDKWDGKGGRSGSV